MSPLSGIRPPMDRILQASVESSYRRFLNLVARGRDMLPEDVDAIAQGRVWTGRKAQELVIHNDLEHKTVPELEGRLASVRQELQEMGANVIEGELVANDG